MSVNLILFILVQVFAFAFFMEALRRTIKRSQEDTLTDSAETLPFGFVRLRHVVVLYALSYVAWVLFSMWLYFVWLNGNPAIPGSSSIKLDL